MLYLGARDVSVPWTTAETHSAPKRAFQYGTMSVGGCEWVGECGCEREGGGRERENVQLDTIDPSGAIVESGSAGSSQSTNGSENVASLPVAKLYTHANLLVCLMREEGGARETHYLPTIRDKQLPKQRTSLLNLRR